MSKNSKAYRAAAEKVNRDNLYSPLQAAKLAKETSSRKQDATVEVAIRLGVDPRKGGEMAAEAIDVILKLWSSDPPYRHDGKYWQFELAENVDEVIVHRDIRTVLAAEFVDSHLANIGPHAKNIREMLNRYFVHRTARYLS